MNQAQASAAPSGWANGPAALRVPVLLVLMLVTPLSMWLEALYLPLYAGSVPLPFTAFAAVVINVAIIFGMETVARSPGGLGIPLALWVLTFLYLAMPGPGGDMMLAATWQTMLLFVLGLFPALGVLIWRIMLAAVAGAKR